jgi:hypothetical protein
MTFLVGSSMEGFGCRKFKSDFWRQHSDSANLLITGEADFKWETSESYICVYARREDYTNTIFSRTVAGMLFFYGTHFEVQTHVFESKLLLHAEAYCIHS